MKDRRWLAVTALVAALAVVPLVGTALAQGPTEGVEGEDEGTWEEGYGCHGTEGMMGDGAMLGSHAMLGDTVTLERVATALGVTYEELAQRLAEGETIQAVAETQGASVDRVVSIILEPHAEALRLRVSYGYLTEEQAETMLEQARLAVEQAVATPRTVLTPDSGYHGGYGAGPMGPTGGAMGGGMMGSGHSGYGGGMMGGGAMGRSAGGWW